MGVAPDLFVARPASIAFCLMGASDGLEYDTDLAADRALWAITYWFNRPGVVGAARGAAITTVHLLFPKNKNKESWSRKRSLAEGHAVSTLLQAYQKCPGADIP